MSHAGVPLTEAQTKRIQASSSVAGFAFDSSRATETFEEKSILFIPSPGQSDLLMLYDRVSGRAVVVEAQGSQGFRFQVIQPGQAPSSYELRLGEDGYFGPQAVLESLKLTDALLADEQLRSCAEPCFKHGHLTACATCTGVGLLRVLRSAEGASGPDSSTHRAN